MVIRQRRGFQDDFGSRMMRKKLDVKGSSTSKQHLAIVTLCMERKTIEQTFSLAMLFCFNNPTPMTMIISQIANISRHYTCCFRALPTSKS